MTDDSMKTLIELVEELAKLRAQKEILIRMLGFDDFRSIDKDIVRRIFDVEVKDDI